MVDWSECWLYATAVGLLATNIIIVNNLRDRWTDVLVDKRTTSVRFGAFFSRVEYVTCYVMAALQILVAAIYYSPSSSSVLPWRLLPFLVTPLAWKETQAVLTKEGANLNPHVGGAAKVEFLVCILIAVAKIMAP